MSGKVHGGKGKSGAKDGGLRSQSHSARAGLQFPVGRVKRLLKKNAQNKVRVGAKGEWCLFGLAIKDCLLTMFSCHLLNSCFRISNCGSLRVSR